MERGYMAKIYQPSYNKYNNRPSQSIQHRPLHHSNIYQSKALSPEPQPPYFKTHEKPKQNKMNLMKSKISYGSASSQKINQNNLFPQELLFLLSQEHKNIEYFKQRIDGEKKKVERDFENFQKQIILLINDLKLSFISQLDQAYRNFINTYRSLKDSVTSMRQLRKNILQNSFKPNFNVKNEYDQNLSNQQLLQEISHDVEYFKNHQIYEEVNTAHKEKMGPVIQISNDLIIIGGYEKSFYNESETAEVLRMMKGNFQQLLNQVYTENLDHLILQTETLLHNNRKEKEENNMLLRGMNDDSREEEEYNYARRSEKNQHEENKRRSGTDGNPYGFNFGSKKNQDPKKKNRPLSHSQNIKFQNKFNDMVPNRQNQFTNEGTKTPVQVPTSQQNLITNWAQEVELEPQYTKTSQIQTLQPQDALLCGVFMGRNYFAVGSKDKNIYVYNISTKKLITRLCGHKASVCCLMNHPQFLASGGDVGCCSLILWDPRTWTIKNRIQNHAAAISGIVDLLDDQSLAVGSYDKRITIYNYRRAQSTFTISGNKTTVSCLAVDSTGKKLISGGLDNYLSVWNIVKRSGKVESIQLDRTIHNCGVVCSLREICLQPSLIIVGNRDGKILLVNIRTGEIQKRFTVGKSSVNEMIIVERKNKPLAPIVVTSCHRDRSLMVTKTDSGLNRQIGMKGRLKVDFGCGIGPKIVMNKDEMMGIVSQSVNDREVCFYKINMN